MDSLHFAPPVIAHRGASGYAPENTLAAFVKAVQLGIKWVEFDVMLAACGVPIVFHDDRLERTTNARGELREYSLAYLEQLDTGSWFHSKFAGERILSLSQLLVFLCENKINANIELKPYPGTEEMLVKKVLDVVQKVEMPGARILFSSFSINALTFLRQYDKTYLLGLLLHEWDFSWEKICKTLDCVSLHVNQAILTQKKARLIKNMNKILLCYTVNDLKRAEKLFSWGVDAVFSDVPDAISK